MNQEPVFKPLLKPPGHQSTSTKDQKEQPEEGKRKQFDDWFDKELGGASTLSKGELFSQLEKPQQTIFTTAYIKGLDADDEIGKIPTAYKQYREKLTHKFKLVDWNPDSTNLRVIQEAPFRKYEASRSATVIGNRTSISLPIRKVLETSI